jgi:hypothetical protein
VEEKSPKFKKMRRLMEEGIIRLEMVDGWMDGSSSRRSTKF